MASSVTRSTIAPRMVSFVAGACVVATALAACGGSSSADAVSGGTFTLAMTSDPGNLDPQASAASNLYQMSYIAYDPLLGIDGSGRIQPELATSWQVTGQRVVLTLHKGITCSDGTPFTATTAADNVNYVADAKNASPFGGVFIPIGAKATADAATDTVTIALASPAPFILNGLAGVPMVCSKGMANRKILATGTDGTGPYQLSQATPDDHYTFTERTGYTWGPGGATTSAKGLPSQIVVKVVPNETTSANLLLSGQINAAAILGPDAKRLAAAGLFAADVPALSGEMWFNQDSGRAAADPQVRLALAEAVDLGQVEKVLTSGQGEPGTTFAVNAPVACPGNSVAKALPVHDIARARTTLDADGWTVGAGGIRAKGGKQLALTFLYNTTGGSAASAAAELAAQQWGQLGVKVDMAAQDETQSTNTLFSTGNWDIAWEPLNVSSPDQLVPFMSGAGPAKGDNFAHISNATYSGAVTGAARTEGAAGCSQWLAAESTLVSSADVIPFANQVEKLFGKGARFSVVGELLPTSIRMGS
jgi:peptide/nickel transport system substrate-binding protein